MKMDDMELKARLALLEATPAFKEFEQGFGPVDLAADPLKTLLLFDAWTNQHAKSDAPTPAAAPVAPAATPPTATPAPPKAVEAAAPAADDVEMKDGEILVQVDAGDDKKATRAAYTRYYRSVRPPKVPAAVAVKFRQACQDKTGKLAAELFAAYMESGENWLSSSIVMEESQAHNETEGGRWGWMTKEETQLIHFKLNLFHLHHVFLLV